MEFLFENKSSLLLLMGVGMMTVILMRRWNRYYRKRNSARRDPRRDVIAASKAQQPLMDAPPEILRWQVEMHETARELKGELDTKIAILQRLTAEARHQADRLEAAAQRCDVRAEKFASHEA